MSYHIFNIANNNTQRHVEYHAKLHEDGTISSEVAWFTPEGERSRDLNWLERNFAYGSKVSYDNKSNKTMMRLSALKSRPIELRKLSSGEVIPVLNMSGKEVKLDRIWVQVSDGTFRIPKVDYVDIFAKDLITDEELSERINP